MLGRSTVSTIFPRYRTQNKLSNNYLFRIYAPVLIRCAHLQSCLTPSNFEMAHRVSANIILLIISCHGLQEEEPQTAHPMSLTLTSHIADIVMTGCNIYVVNPLPLPTHIVGTWSTFVTHFPLFPNMTVCFPLCGQYKSIASLIGLPRFKPE